ncbi:tetratricopeptide repeat protein [Sorangium sp. So ce426]|uniref:tetratricopeptide repeat protein n=1 Tax=unclassified Sorangium TaxID=2621164 RepID=UPI003F5BD170
MKEKDDVLREAARALRAEADASRARRDATRARVMRSLKAQRARRLAMVRVVVPLAAVLVGSVAWASAARWFPGGWDDVASRLGLRVSEAPTMPPAPPPQRALSGPQRATEAPAPPEAEAEASAEAAAPEPPPLPAPIAEPPIAPAPPRAPVLAVAPVRSASRPVAAVAPSSARQPTAPRPAAGDPQAIERPPAGPDVDALYQAAHRAHFVERNPAAALDAWNAYLAAAPRGRFAVEAQYNRALCFVRLGRKDEARRALEPFAQGALGGYRKDESRSLLEAMRSADE